ncbi:MAG: MBL fold metallo-hydrolase [Clostridium chrysemydis]|uniref:MBL fold metallo-hydrolase n=1 Tax=Clostridium chrysemydis TaxID=2665504 RepID=UPI003F3C691F
MIKVLASGSKGNSYIVKAREEILLLELGIPFKEVLKGLKFDLSMVKGCLISHIHKDHSKSIGQAIKHGLDIYCNSDVAKDITTERRINIIEPLKKFTLGGFTILPFECNHTNNDESVCPNLGFLIEHKAIGKVLFATDTYYLKYTFKGLKHVLIECNYSENELENIPSYRARILKSHMSLETLINTLESWDLKGIEEITLIHLSENNADQEYFKAQIEKETGCMVSIAAPGLIVGSD